MWMFVRWGFNGKAALESADFQAAATVDQVATMTYPASDGAVSTGNLSASGLRAINKTGKTQLRIYFATTTDNDSGADYLGFHPGEAATAAFRPQLIVTYSEGQTGARRAIRLYR